MNAKPIRIAVLHFSHETVTFLPNDTTLADFTFEGSPATGEALLRFDPRGYMGGFVKMAREYPAVELVGITSPLWPKTGTGSGWVTQEAFETFVGTMMRELAETGPYDGAYLCVHGAMGVRGVPRPEAELAKRTRAALGPDAIISATFDPHGNEDEEFLRHANMAFTVKYFPHYDSYLQGERAARCLIRTLRADYTPTHVTQRVPILSPTVVQWTGASPWMDLIQRALVWEAREPDVFVNVFFGFPWSDVPDAGMTFQVITNNNSQLARKIATDMAEWAWRKREALLNTVTIHPMAEAVSLAKQAVHEKKSPVVLADYSDRSGYATWLLREIVDQNLSRTLIGTVTDAAVVQHLLDTQARPGDAFDMEVGGLADISAGQPVRITGTIVSTSTGENRAAGQTWFHIGFGDGNVLVISPFLAQILTPETFATMGLDPARFDIFAIKSRAHFRRGFDDSGFAPTILLVEPPEPFMGTVRLEALPYEHLDLTKFYPFGNPVFTPGT
jgi:microcystin degradation protein MlrC